MPLSRGCYGDTGPLGCCPAPGHGSDGSRHGAVPNGPAGPGEVWRPHPGLCAPGEPRLLPEGKTLPGTHPGPATVLRPVQAATGDDGADVEQGVRRVLGG